MKIIITGRKMSVKDDLKELITKKLSRLDKYFKDDATAYVTLSVEKNAERLELTVSSCGTLFRGEKSSETFNNSLDDVMDIIERQIRKNKTKLQRKLREGAIKTLEQEAPTEEENKLDIIRTKTFEIQEMSPDEAALQMELLGHEFYMFKNADNGKTEVIYKRVNGGYGVIAPQ